MTKERSLEGKVAVVTGGSKGIGRAIAETFAAAGASVALAARGEGALKDTAAAIEEAGGRAVALPTDVTDPEQVTGLMDGTVEAFGGIDILVNNAGAAPFFSTIDSIRLEGFEKYFRVNFLSAVYCTRAAAPHLLSRPGACVLNMASVAAFIANPGLTYYGSAKAALVNLTKTVAREWAAAGVRVNAVAPGWIETDMNEGVRASTPEFNEMVLSNTPLGRWGLAEEVAAAALFLCSPAASFITGSVLIVDGGLSSSTLTAF